MKNSRSQDLEHIYVFDKDSGDFSKYMNPIEILSRFGESWNLISVSIREIHIDRRRGCFGGPLFTSESFPWPMDRGHDLLEPVIQVDLRDLSELKGKPFGDGLLQVWMDVDKFMRVIPRAAVDHEPLDPIPIEKIHREWWSDGKDWTSNTVRALQVIGYEGPLFSCGSGIAIEKNSLKPNSEKSSSIRI